MQDLDLERMKAAIEEIQSNDSLYNFLFEKIRSEEVTEEVTEEK